MNDDEAEVERRLGDDRRSGDERREESDRRVGVERRGSGLKTRCTPGVAYQYHFRSFEDRRGDDRRRVDERRLTAERRFGYAGSPTLLTAEELAALLTPSDD